MGSSRRRGARILACAATLTLVPPLVLPAMAEPTIALDQSRATYIVAMEEEPIATYEGGVAGIPATAPGQGRKVDTKSANARAYAAHLRAEQQKALREARLPNRARTHEYTVALNGFTADLTAGEAAALAKADGVAHLWKDELRHAETVTTPDYLGLTGDTGVWRTQFGGDANAGRGIVVGVLDTGIDPGNPSFAEVKGGPAAPKGFECAVRGDTAFRCSNKIVGARSYGKEFGNDISYDVDSPRDTNGHGSHTASTSAGNHGVRMIIAGTDLGLGSGMAPAAQIAVYKGLWQTASGSGSGTTSGLVAAIDDAVADGVDVINYSISGSQQYVVGADELAFLRAAQAGIFVATSAGNSGDTVGASSVAHNAPWTTTVAASTHSRGAEKTVTLGNDSRYVGVGVGVAVGPAKTVLAGDVAWAGVSAQAARECWLDADNNAANGQQPTLDPAKVAGAIVVCDRGTVARTDKSAAVKAAGGIGMIQTNTSNAQSLNADFHTVPSIHVDATAGAAIKAYVSKAKDAATSTISAVSAAPVDAPSMAGFSSYGPALAGEGDLLKPDITAPGVDVIAAVSAGTNGEARYDSLSGTSMSAPHIAGLAALLKQKNPSWSPMAVKSAMMTTARQTTNAGKKIQWAQGDATPLNYGAGEVVPARSYNPGLVFDSGPKDWYAYACAIKQLQLVGGAQFCATLPQVDPSNVNNPTIAVGALAGFQEVSRRVTNVSGRMLAFTPTVEAPAGFTVTVTPKRLNVPAGKTGQFKVTITRTTAPLDAWAFGSVTWVPEAGASVESVRSALAVRPVAIAAPGEVTGTVAGGSTGMTLTPGFTGTLGTDVDGLLPSTRTPVAVTRTENTPLDGHVLFQVPAGTKTTRVATWSSEVPAADIDLTLYSYDGAKLTPVGSSGNGDSTESVTESLTPGTYVAAIDLFSQEPTATVPVHVWNLGESANGSMTVTPTSAAVTSGVQTTVTAAWSGLAADRRYLGRVNFLEGGTVVGSTLVSVNP